jgi:predicted N-acetyltransferase YhbS
VIPAILLGRLAVATAHRGKRLGGALVADALARAGQSHIMAYAMVVEAKDAEAGRFYEHLGFEPLPDNALRLLRRL